MVNIRKHNKLTEKKVQLSYVDFLCVLNNINKKLILHLLKVEMTILCRKGDKSKPYLKYAFELIFNQICGLVDVDKTIMKSKCLLVT